MMTRLTVIALTLGLSIAAAAAPIRIVAFGDSTTAPRTVEGEALVVYSDLLPELLADSDIVAEVVNAGIGGNTTAHAQKRFENDVLDANPDWVVIQFGLNDAAVDVSYGRSGPRVELEDYRDNLRGFVRKLHSQDVRVVLMTPNPMFWTEKLKEYYGGAPYDLDDRWGMNPMVRQYAQVVRDLARDYGTGLVDVFAAYEAYDAVEGQDAAVDGLLDGLHPNGAAHAQIAAGIAEEIASLVAVDARPQQDLFISGEHEVNTFRIPAITYTTKGTLLAVADARIPNGRDLPNNIDLVVRRSEDEGATWSPMETIMDYPGMEGGGDSALLTDRDTGRVWIFYVYTPEGIGLRNSKPGLEGDTMQLQLMWSDDDGHTWEGPRPMNAAAKDPTWLAAWSSPGVGFQDKDGSLYFPFSRRIEGGLPFTQYMVSRDHGETWSTVGPSSSDTNESMIIQREDGTLVSNMRSNHDLNRRAIAFSSDGGETWSGFTHHDDLIEPVCSAALCDAPMAAAALKKPVWFFSNPASVERRNMTARFSFDEGETWPIAERLHYGPAAYSAAVEIPGNRVAVLYERGTKNPYERITFAIVELNE